MCAIPPSRLEMIANARGHSSRFHATNGGHLTSDEIFIAAEINLCKKVREVAEKDMKVHQQQQTNEERALKVLSREGAGPELYSLPELNYLLAWHQVNFPPKSRKAEKLAQWREIVVSQKFLQLCQATATGIDSMGHFEWADLVQIGK